MASMAATSEICARKLHTPSDRNSRSSLRLSRKLLLFSLTALVRVRYHTASAAVTTCPSTVATAAPIMPHLNT